MWRSEAPKQEPLTYPLNNKDMVLQLILYSLHLDLYKTHPLQDVLFIQGLHPSRTSALHLPSVKVHKPSVGLTNSVSRRKGLTVVNVGSICGDLEVSHSQGLQWRKLLSLLKPLKEKAFVIKLREEETYFRLCCTCYSF